MQFFVVDGGLNTINDSKSLHDSIDNIKKATSAAAKTRELCTGYVDEFMIRSRSDSRCSLCSVLGKSEKGFYVESHRKLQRHERPLKRKNSKQAKQVLIKMLSLQFNEKVISAFLETDIPLHMLNNSSLKSVVLNLCAAKLFEKH